MFKGRHFDRSVILLCIRLYLAYNLSLRNLEEMMAERGISVDHATIHRWVVRYSPELLRRFNARKRAVTGKWHADETYIKVRGRWMYLYRAIDSNGDTVEFWFSERRNLAAAKRFLSQALKRHGSARESSPSIPFMRAASGSDVRLHSNDLQGWLYDDRMGCPRDHPIKDREALLNEPFHVLAHHDCGERQRGREWIPVEAA